MILIYYCLKNPHQNTPTFPFYEEISCYWAGISMCYIGFYFIESVWCGSPLKYKE